MYHTPRSTNIQFAFRAQFATRSGIGFGREMVSFWHLRRRRELRVVLLQNLVGELYTELPLSYIIFRIKNYIGDLNGDVY